MSKEVVIQSWCDGEHEHREPATVERTESLEGEPYQLDLCEVCAKAYAEAVEQVRAWLERGVPVAQVTAPPVPPRTRQPSRAVGRPMARPEFNTVAMRTCQERACIDPRTGEQYVGPTRTALGQHVKKQHDKRLGDYSWPI